MVERGPRNSGEKKCQFTGPEQLQGILKVSKPPKGDWACAGEWDAVAQKKNREPRSIFLIWS